MKLLLINPPKEEEFSLFVPEDYNKVARSNQPPLGLLYLHSYLKNKHDVEIFDMNALELPISAVINKIETVHPDLIGITCVIAKWFTVKKLCKEIKNFKYIPIVLGGINPSLYPLETLQDKNIEYVISGFGQEPLENLCNAIENNKNVNNIKNVYTYKNLKQKIKGTFDFVDVDEFPMPDRGILDINNYQMPFAPENPCTNMITSMGCPYKCKYCACKNYEPVLLRTPQNIISEMKNIQNLGIKSILFQDELFTMNSKRIKEICSLILENNINLNWSVRSRANLIDKEALKMMKKAGCFNVHLGIESGTDRILIKMGKGLNIDLIKKSVDTIKSVGLGVTASFMLGYVDETEAEIMQTIKFAKELDLNVSQFFVTQPEPNTELYQELKQIKNLPEDIYSDFTLNPENVDLNNNIASTLFTRKEMDDFVKYAYSQVKSLYDIKGVQKI